MFDTPHLHSDLGKIAKLASPEAWTEKLAQLLVAHLNPEHSTPILQASLGPHPNRGGYCLIGADAKDVAAHNCLAPEKREGVSAIDRCQHGGMVPARIISGVPPCFPGRIGSGSC